MPYLNIEKYYRKALECDVLSGYYKYSNPSLSLHYHEKHLAYLKQAARQARQQVASGRIRILHSSKTAPGQLDIYVNGSIMFSGISFKQITSPLSLPRANYFLEVYEAGQQKINLAAAAFTILPGQETTLALAGHSANFRIMPIQDSSNVPEGETRIRFVHLTPRLATVDIAVSGGDVLFHDISYKDCTEYMALVPMSADLAMRHTGTREVILDIPRQLFSPNKSYTYYIIPSNESPIKAEMIKAEA
ncbi:DUF4397 domain-containing protein [Peribacillus sp. SCS-155]|uniref:DUF4397 domain-containing protein n=1 Tax=Peribacillus sedimenti TaxID=3115297 RepID=UPI003905A543